MRPPSKQPSQADIISPRIKLVRSPDEPIRAEVDHPDYEAGVELLMKAIGTDNRDFLDGLLSQLVLAGANGKKASETQTNFILSIVKGIEPCDAIEALLATQMAVVHNAVMLFARDLSTAPNLPQRESAERAFNRLARTFSAQVSALKIHRSKGEQRMIIQRIDVSDGGQAVIGTVTPAPRGANPQKGEQPHVVRHALGDEMPRQIKAERASMPCAGR